MDPNQRLLPPLYLANVYRYVRLIEGSFTGIYTWNGSASGMAL